MQRLPSLPNISWTGMNTETTICKCQNTAIWMNFYAHVPISFQMNKIQNIDI